MGQSLKYYNADDFPLIGKMSDDTEGRYARLPLSCKGKVKVGMDIGAGYTRTGCTLCDQFNSDCCQMGNKKEGKAYTHSFHLSYQK